MVVEHPLLLRPPRPRLGFFLLYAMGAGTFTAALISILGGFLVDEFGLTRAQLGLIVAVNTIGGGLASPFAGRFVDRVGGGAAMQVLMNLAAAAFLVTAVANVYVVLVIGAVVGGLAQALANPSTNKVIAYRYEPSRRANITGIKQSGVQFAIFFGGLTLPSLAEWFGWRWAVASVAGVTLLVSAWLFVARQGISSGRTDSGASGLRALSGAVPWLAGYGLLLGFSGSSSFFLPLFAQEELGQSARVGGFALALAGITAVVGRVVWARFAEKGSRYRLTLALLAGLAVLGSWLFTLADTATAFLWIGAVLMGAGASSWNSVGMLAVIDDSEATDTGVASGWVLLGFLLGLGVGPPIFGQTFDSTGSYMTMWIIAAVFAGLAFILMLAWKATSVRASRTSTTN